MNRTQAQATRKIREAMSGLRTAMKTASATHRKLIAKELTELRSIKTEIRAMDEEEMDEGMDMLDDLPVMDDPGAEDDLDLPMDSLPAMDEDDLGMDEMSDMDFGADEPMDMLDEDMGDEDWLDEDMGDEELAMSALDLAAASLRAAAEEEEDSDADADASEEDSEEDSEDESDDEEDAESEGDEDSEEDSEDEDSEDEDSEDEDSGEGSAEEEDGDLETLTEDELKALEKEGLLEGRSFQARRINARLARVSKRLNRIIATDGDVDFGIAADDEGLGRIAYNIEDTVPPNYVEDQEASEYLSVADVRELLAGMTPSERRAFVADNRTSSVSAAKRKKMSKSQRAQAAKKAVKNRKLRKLRTKMKKSKKGMKGSINTKSGRKKVKKMYYFNTYDSKGKFLGSYWFTSQSPSKKSRTAYKNKYGVKHPADLTKVNDKRLEDLKKRRRKK